VYPASRSGLCAPLAYLCHPEGQEVVIYANPWSEWSIWSLFDVGIAPEWWLSLSPLGQLVAVFSALVVFVQACKDFAPQGGFQIPTPEEVKAWDDAERETSAARREAAAARRLSFAEDPIRPFIGLFLFVSTTPYLYLGGRLIYEKFFKAPAAAAAAEAAAAELLANEPPPRDGARPGLRRRAHRGRRRGRARGTAADEPSATESPVAPESKTEEPPAAPEAKREEEETPAATGPPPGKKVLVDDDILDEAAAHARTLETSLTAHQAEVQRLKKILKEQQREIPDAYLCPITMDPMEDPCIAADGHSYERRAITDWFARGNNTSPKTGAQLDDTRLFPNHALKSAIQDFLEEVRRFDAATAGARD
jgi:hypothetical protein